VESGGYTDRAGLGCALKPGMIVCGRRRKKVLAYAHFQRKGEDRDLSGGEIWTGKSVPKNMGRAGGQHQDLFGRTMVRINFKGEKRFSQGV